MPKEGLEEQVRHAFPHGDSLRKALAYPLLTLKTALLGWALPVRTGRWWLNAMNAESRGFVFGCEDGLYSSYSREEKRIVTMHDPMLHVPSSPRARDTVYIGKTGVNLSHHWHLNDVENLK